MISAGMEDEVRRLLADGLNPDDTAMQGIGYKELSAWMRGEIGRDEAIELWKKRTRNYAKRQETWFRREKERSLDRCVRAGPGLRFWCRRPHSSNPQQEETTDDDGTAADGTGAAARAGVCHRNRRVFAQFSAGTSCASLMHFTQPACRHRTCVPCRVMASETACGTRQNECLPTLYGAQAALVRPQIISGTHALAIALFGVLRPGDLLCCVTGAPYDTMEEIIGIRPSDGSLAEFGVSYAQCDLTASPSELWEEQLERSASRPSIRSSS